MQARRDLLGKALLILVLTCPPVLLLSTVGGQDPPSPDELLAEARAQLQNARGERDAEKSAELFRDAIETFSAAQRGFDDAGADRRVIEIYTQIATCLQNLNRYEDGLALIEEGQRRLDAYAAGPEADPGFVSLRAFYFHTRASVALRRIGRDEEAVERCRRAVTIAERARLRAPTRSAGYVYLGAAHLESGNPAGAATAYRTALEIARRAPLARRAEIELPLAHALLDLGETEEAFTRLSELRKQAPEPTVENHRLQVAMLTVGAAAAWQMERYAEAETTFTEALSLLERFGRDRTLDGALVRIWSADTILRQGRTEQTRESVTEARKILEECFDHEHPALIDVLELTAASFRDEGRRTGDRAKLLKARGTFSEAVALSRRLGSHRIHFTINSLAKLILTDFEDIETAAELYQEAIAEFDSARARATALASQGSRYFEQLRKDARWDPYEGVSRAMFKLGRPGEAFRFLEQSRGRTVLDILEASRFDAIGEVRRRAESRNDATTLANIDGVLADGARAATELARLQAAMDRGEGDRSQEVRAARGRLQDALRRRAELTEGLVPAATPAGPQEIRRLLAQDERMLFYLLGDEESYVLVVPPPGGKFVTAPLQRDGVAMTADVVRREVDSYLAAVQNEGARATRGLERVDPPKAASSAVAGHRLFRAIMPERIWKAIEGCKLVTVVPHGALHLLPFESLVTKAGATARESEYWLTTGPAVTYTPSGSVLAWSAKRRKTQEALDPLAAAVVVADPTFELPHVFDPNAAPTRGATVTAVEVDGPGARAGLRAGDVITRYGEREIDTPDTLAKLTKAEVGDDSDVLVKAWREGSELELTTKRGELGVELGTDAPPKELARLRGFSLKKISGPTTRSKLGALPGARREADAIETTFAGVTRPEEKIDVEILRGDDASETALFNLAPSARFLHVATHQIPDTLGRWEAGRIVLRDVPIASAADDGFLDLDDLLAHWRGRLDRCELVVLSACRSRIGILNDDEGLLALPWGFLYSGCPTVVASAWPVADEATATLMSEFYGELPAARGRDRILAFTEARKKVGEQYPEPFFWAPFVWIGAP